MRIRLELGCDACESRWWTKVYRDEGTNVSFRACWRPSHRQQAKIAVARRAALLRGPRPRQP
jgi:hypothetical protein